MKPRFFEPEQQAAVEAALEQLDIGDLEGRRIFALALEYELAEYEKNVARNPEPEPENDGGRELEEITAAVSGLSALLETLPEAIADELCTQLSSADIYQRRYERKYLTALTIELERVASACREMSRQVSSSRDQVDEAEIRFMEMVAEAYAECFEAQPSVDDEGPFVQLLEQIVRIADLGIRVQGPALPRILERERP